MPRGAASPAAGAAPAHWPCASTRSAGATGLVGDRGEAKEELEVVGRKVERSGNLKAAGSGIMFWIEPQAVTLQARAAIAAPRANIRRPPIHRAAEPIRSLRNRSPPTVPALRGPEGDLGAFPS